MSSRAPARAPARAVDAATEAFLLASRALVAVAARSLAGEEQVTLPQFRALVVIGGAEPVTVRQLAEALDIQSSTATRLCDRLVGKSLIRRLPGVSADRRETTLVLTARGRRLVERVTEHRRRDLAGIVARLSPTARRQALDGLRAFAEAAGEVEAADAFAWGPEPGAGAPGPPRRSGGAGSN